MFRSELENGGAMVVEADDESILDPTTVEAVQLVTATVGGTAETKEEIGLPETSIRGVQICGWLASAEPPTEGAGGTIRKVPMAFDGMAHTGTSPWGSVTAATGETQQEGVVAAEAAST